MTASIRVYWSKQHGAYVTLVTAWIINIILNGFSFTQAASLVFLLSGLNLTELLSAKFFRKSALPSYQVLWLKLYAVIVACTGLILLAVAAAFIYIAPPMLAGSAVYLILFRKRMQKHFIAEWIIFFLISVAAFIGAGKPDLPGWIPAILVMSAFFGSSIFVVKARLGKFSRLPAILYALISAGALVVIYSFNMFGTLVALLILAKTSGTWLFPKTYSRLPIPIIGVLEMVFQLMLVIVFFLYKEEIIPSLFYQ